jgi:hypothetical protein
MPVSKRSCNKLILAAALALLIIALFSLKNFPDFVEKYYAHGLYLYIATALQWFYGIFPFSVGDIVYAAIIILAVAGAIKLVRYIFSGKRKASARLSLKGIIGLEFFILLFYLFWGMNYFRAPVAKRLHLTDSCYTNTALTELTSIMIDSANALRAGLSASDFQRSDSDIMDTSVNAVRAFTAEGFASYYPEIKKSLFSALMNYTGTSGYYNPLTAEAQLNYKMPVFLKPFTACHEMAHQMGFAAEDEANFAGFVIGISSKDRLLRYSSYYLGAAECLNSLRRLDSVTYNTFRNRISPMVMHDYRIDQQYWMKYQGQISSATGLFFDKYLKANNQPEGLRRYNLMIKLLLGWYRKNGLLRSPCLSPSNPSLSPRQE